MRLQVYAIRSLLVYEDALFMSYYSSHEAKTAIYLMRMAIDQWRR